MRQVTFLATKSARKAFNAQMWLDSAEGVTATVKRVGIGFLVTVPNDRTIARPEVLVAARRTFNQEWEALHGPE